MKKIFQKIKLACNKLFCGQTKTEKNEKVENETLENVEKEADVNPGDFIVDEDDENLFHNVKRSDFSVRIMKSNSGAKEKNKDQLVFATSLPHKFNSFTPRAMKNYVPQLIDISFSGSHEIVVTKSPASKFKEVQDLILRFLFVRFNVKYNWLYEEQVVLIESRPNSDILVFNLKVQTCDHLELGAAMMEIKGICGSSAGNGLPLCMDHSNRYDFHLEKGRAFEWEELLPKIKNTFREHFKGEVKFVEKM